jgi:hypothetical protein
MAQGRFLSVTARLYANQEKPELADSKLIDYAKKTMEPLEKHVSESGLMQWLCISGRNDCLVWYAE